MLRAKSCLHRSEQLPWQQAWDQPQEDAGARTVPPRSRAHAGGPVQRNRIHALPLARAGAGLPQPNPALGSSGAPAGGGAGSAVWHGTGRHGLQVCRLPVAQRLPRSVLGDLLRLGWHQEREDVIQFSEHVADSTTLDTKRRCLKRVQGEQHLCGCPVWWLFGLGQVWLAPFTSSAVTWLSRCVHASQQGWFGRARAGRETVAGADSSPFSLPGSSRDVWVFAPGHRSLPPESPFQKAFTSWILCNRSPVPAPILAAQVTGGLQEPLEIKEPHLKGPNRNPGGSACSNPAAKSAS